MSALEWNFDLTHSSVSFVVRHMVVAKVRGQFKSWAGSLSFDPADPSGAHVSAEIDASGIDTGVGDRDNHLRSADFFDVEKFPKLRFESKRVEAVGRDKFRVTGDLTIRDVTREVELDVSYGGAAKDPWGKTRAAFEAKTSINRSDYGLTWNQVLEAGGVLVSEKIDIELDIEAVAAS